jgi:GMC oxidoreductase
MRIKSAVLISMMVVPGSLCLAQTQESALAQNPSLLSAIDPADKKNLSTTSAPPRRGKKGVMMEEPLPVPTDRTIRITDESPDKNAAASGKVSSLRESKSELREVPEIIREVVSEPALIRFTPSAAPALSADETARLRYQFVTSPPSRSRFAFLKGIFPKRLKTFWHRSKARTARIEQSNQLYDVKNVFVTDGSAFVSTANQNPTLTILALTIRACEYLAEEYKRGNL